MHSEGVSLGNAEINYGEVKWFPWGKAESAAGVPGLGPHVLNEFARRRNNKESVICAVYGGPGVGKTYWALAAAQLLDPKFDASKQILFSREQILNVVNGATKIQRGQVLIIDEAQFSMLSRSFANVDQITTINQLVAIRSRGFIIFIVILGVSMLDKIARDFSLSHKAFLLHRGHARVYAFKQSPLSKEPYPETLSDDCRLPLPDSLPLKGRKGCLNPFCLTCEFSGLLDKAWNKRNKWDELGFTPCKRGKAVYERDKRAFLEQHALDDMEKRKPRAVTGLETFKVALLDHIKTIGTTEKGHLNLDDIAETLNDAVGSKPPVRMTRVLRTWYEDNHSDEMKRRKEEHKAKNRK